MRRPSSSGLIRAALAILAAGVALLLAGTASAAVVPTFTRVTQEGGIAADCTAPLPGGAGAASATYSHFAGIGTIQTTWNMPAQITPGAQVTLGLQMTASQAFNALILLNAPAEFGGAPAPFEVARSLGPGGGSTSGSLTITFTPTRAFTPGERHILRLGNGCNAFLYEYVASGTPDAPAPPGPAIVPPTTRPIPGVVTSYAAPRPGRVLALPFPKGGCAPPATAAQTGPAPSAGGDCEVDVFLRRRGGGAIHDRGATFALDTRVTASNARKAQTICLAFVVDQSVRLQEPGEDEFRAALDRSRTCVLVVARILQRAEDLRRARRQTAHAAHSCAVRAVRLRGQPRGASPVSVRCRHTATGTRLTIRPARRGATVASLLTPASRLLIGRSDAVRHRPGDRIDVLWRVGA